MNLPQALFEKSRDSRNTTMYMNYTGKSKYPTTDSRLHLIQIAASPPKYVPRTSGQRSSSQDSAWLEN